jgi:2-polyprenyl-3-methyl-5-hydroxy-6-metoxy-1,4-benzoquinol methylase
MTKAQEILPRPVQPVPNRGLAAFASEGAARRRGYRLLVTEAPDGTDSELPNDSQQMAVALVGPGQDVLEVGCGSGHVTARLAANGCTVTGIDIDPAAASVARAHAVRVHVADLDRTAPGELVGAGRRFDRILLGDVLEHLKDPERFLVQLADLLAPEGFLVASIPNVTHADVRLMLLSGQWRTQDQGLLDRGHLHLFDRRAVIELFHSAGWRIERLERTVKPPFESELAGLVPRALFSDELVEMVTADPDSSVYQFVVVARPGVTEATDSGPGGVEWVAPPIGDRAMPSSDLDRLLAENEYLRIRVRELEERLEDVLWVRAIWRQRARRLGNALRVGPRRAARRLRASGPGGPGAGNAPG